MSTPGAAGTNREARRRAERAARRKGNAATPTPTPVVVEEDPKPLPGQFWRSWLPFLLAPLIGAAAVLLEQRGANPAIAAGTGAVLGLLFATGALVRLWLARRLGRWTSLAALVLGAGTIMGATVLVFPSCPGRIGDPGPCSQYEVGTYMLLGALTVVAATLAGSIVGVGLRLPGRAGRAARVGHEIWMDSRTQRAQDRAKAAKSAKSAKAAKGAKPGTRASKGSTGEASRSDTGSSAPATARGGKHPRRAREG